MKQVIMIPQLVTLILIIIATCLVFKNMRKRAHFFLFVNCISLLLYSVGALLTLFVETEEAFFIAFVLSWAGKVGVVVSMLFFCIYFFECRLPAFIAAFEGGFAAITYAVIVTTKKTGLFYKDFHLVKEKGVTIAEYKHGPWYVLWLMTIFAVISTCTIMLFRALSKEKVKQRRKQHIAILIALLIEFAVGFLTKLPIGRYYDFNQLGFSLCVILVLLAIFRNNFMETESMAKEYIIDELSAGVIAMGKGNKVAYCNKTAQQIFPEIVKDERDVIERMEASIRTGEPITVFDRIYNFEQRKLVHRSCEESDMYVIIDSTKHYQHLKEVEKEKQIADEANRAKTAFLAGMSHEIRTPINAILGMDEMILRESTEGVIKDYATDIQNAGHTLLTIVNEILDLNKIESGKMELTPVEYDLLKMTDGISNMIKFRAEDKRLSFIVSVSPDVPRMLKGDDVKVRQVLMNLLTNAVKYTQIGTVWFRVDLKETKEGKVLLHFEVEDTGIGIKQEDIAKVFSVFERVEAERNRNIEGAGLGIPITMRLLSMMGAELKVESEYGKGSVFSFDLRQELAGEALPKTQEKQAKEGGSEKCADLENFTAPDARILVVDDSLVNLKVFTSLLKKAQVKVTEANSGYKAVELAAAQPFDIIFMDHMMPGMDGVAALQKIKEEKDSPCADTPVIVLTANAIEGSREAYLEAGFDGYISKPIVYEELVAIIAEHLTT